jgi:hypothetical protein
VLALALAGCGGGGGSGTISVGAAKTWSLRHLPNSRVQIVQPDGSPLTAFKTGSGPHTGVHVIFVRRDLGAFRHLHPTVQPDGSFHVERGGLPPGPYRVIVDAYPASGPQPNFQVFENIVVPGTYAPKALPALQRSQVVDGYRFELHGTPKLHAITPGFLSFTVTSPTGKPAQFSPWFGALAHAIFVRKGTLDYFHTHVCAPGAAGCTSVLAGANVTGRSATPGKLDVGVLVPLAGTWRLFLQTQVDGRVLTVPFTLHVS